MATAAILISVIIVSLLSLIGVVLLPAKSTLKKILIYLVSFSTGALFGDVFIHLLPEMAEMGFSLKISLYILAGILVSFIVEKYIHWHHCHHDPDEKCDHHHPFAIMSLVGDAVHNLIDGMIIAASYLVAFPVGVATTIAVVLHEIPQEIGDFAILLHGGFSRLKALAFNLLTALTAIVGAIIVIFLGQIEGVLTFLIPFAAGNFLYIAGSDLVPELHKVTDVRKSLFQLLWLILGVVVMFLLLFLE
tara:strand:- start:624 stop:1364 length:741 start_codon:yes stop_codon:yes gene_type:complete